MADLFRKLNTLIKAGLNDLLPKTSEAGTSPRPAMQAQLGRDAALLRDRVNRALDQEAALQARVQQLLSEIEAHDRAADNAVQQGNDASARKHVEQMQQTQKFLAMADADLREHQRVTAELIQNVNRLEAALADHRAQQKEQAVADADAVENIAERLLRETRETLNRMNATISATLGRHTNPAQSESPEVVSSSPASSPVQPQEATAPPPTQASPTGVDDDLERRRKRLSKPDS